MGKKKKRRSRAITIPLAPMIGLAAGMAEPIRYAMEGNIPETIEQLKFNYVGLTRDNRFDVNGLMKGVLPLVVGLLVHKFVGGSPLNLNRILARANVPFIRI